MNPAQAEQLAFQVETFLLAKDEQAMAQDTITEQQLEDYKLGL